MSFRINWSGRAHDYTEEEINTVVKIMKEADPQTQGKYLVEFEKAFGEFIGQKHSFGMTNCANALEVIADLCLLKKGDEVIVPGHTYCATAIPFARTGATIRWADLDPKNFLVSLKTIEPLVTKNTKAIVLVHLYGMMCPDIEEIAAFAKSKGIFLVEDCAQAIGARHKGRHCGTFGDFGAYSFHAQKNITTMGEGGALTVKSDAHAALIPGLRHNGHAPFKNQPEYWLPAMSNIDLDIDGIWPHNFSMSETVAGLGTQLLKRCNKLNEERRKRADKFTSAFSGFSELQFQKTEQPLAHAYHLMPARYTNPKATRDDLIRLLSKEYGIKAIVQYYPLYRYDLFKKMGQAEANCPQVDSFFDNMVSFPFHQWMSETDFDYLIDSTKAALTALRK